MKKISNAKGIKREFRSTGCLWIALVVGIFSLFIVPMVKAKWDRFIFADERIDLKGWSARELLLVHDKLNNVDCYIIDGNDYRSGNAIFCMKAEK